MDNHKDGTIIFYGPVGGKKGIIGGGESGNRKTLQILSKNHIPIIVIEKPYPTRFGFRRLDPIAYFFKLLVTYIKLVIRIVACQKPCTVHISGFYNHLIYFEFPLVKTAKVLGAKVIYEIRAGGLLEGYHDRGTFYRKLFDATLKNSAVILCQGEKYLSFLRKRNNKGLILHYPNFIMNEYSLSYDDNHRHNAKRVKLIYFGRLTPSKNLEFLFDIATQLQSQEVVFSLTIIGSGEVAYENSLQQRLTQQQFQGTVQIFGPKSNNELFQILKGQHFFLFPTKEKREGHSNSLTEAMNCGVVPIASDIGFNSSIIGNDELIIREFDPVAYASKIGEIGTGTSWSILSREVQLRVNRMYTENQATAVLRQAYFSK